ncbi:MAG TPA: hypothetical protein VJN65_07985 [Bacteroidota bacterium]|nr:hypothetical protein [Bacteroidota bacterium]
MDIPILAYVAGLSTLFPVVTGGIRFRGLDREFRMLLLVFFLEVLSALFQIVLAFQGINNLFLGHFYVFVEFILFLIVFSRWSVGIWKTVIIQILVFFVLFWILSHVFFERLDQPAYYSSILSKVFYTGISIVMLHRISSASDRSILFEPRFWIFSGLLVFSSGGLMFSFLRSVIDKLPPDGLTVAYSIHWAISIVTNTLYAVGFLCKPQVQNSGGRLELAR